MTTLELVDNFNVWMNGFQSDPALRSTENWTIRFQAFRKELFKTLFTEVPNLNSFSITYRGMGRTELVVNDSTFDFTRNRYHSDAYKSWLIEINLKESEMDLIHQVFPFVSGPVRQSHVEYACSREKLIKEGVL